MGSYINKVWLSGTVMTHPKLRMISEKTKLTSFTLSVLEIWTSPGGEERQHRNEVLVEVLGKDADLVEKNLSPGDWVSVDGYLRTDQVKGQISVKVRVYNISFDRGEIAK